MSSDDLVTCVASERPLAGMERYDLSVYRIGMEFFASWFCPRCGGARPTSRCHSQSVARRDGIAAIEAHHASIHGARRE